MRPGIKKEDVREMIIAAIAISNGFELEEVIINDSDLIDNLPNPTSTLGTITETFGFPARQNEGLTVGQLISDYESLFD